MGVICYEFWVNSLFFFKLKTLVELGAASNHSAPFTTENVSSGCNSYKNIQCNNTTRTCKTRYLLTAYSTVLSNYKLSFYPFLSGSVLLQVSLVVIVNTALNQAGQGEHLFRLKIKMVFISVKLLHYIHLKPPLHCPSDAIVFTHRSV